MALTKVRGAGIDADGQEVILDADGDTTLTVDTDDQIDIKVGGTDRAVFLANNMHLIGGTVARIQLSSSGTGTTPNTGNNNVHIEGNDDSLVFNAAGNGNTIFQENGTERMRIENASGKLLIGKNTTSTSTAGIETRTTGSDAGRSNIAVASEAFYFYDSSDGAQVGYIIHNGSGTTYGSGSDYRLKENIVTDWDATTRLKQLKPTRFSWKKESKTQADTDGFLAHEVSSVVPEAVRGEKDSVDADGNPDYQGVDQSKLVPLLTKALQEAVAKIETLEAKVTALENA